MASFVCEPHAAVCCDRTAPALNLVAAESEAARGAMTMLAREAPERLGTTLLRTYESRAESFEALVGLSGVGARTLRALALLSEVLAGAPPSWRDPARFAFAHGGKDGHPFPVDRRTYDRTISLLEEAVRRARLGEPERLQAIRRLQEFARA